MEQQLIAKMEARLTGMREDLRDSLRIEHKDFDSLLNNLAVFDNVDQADGDMLRWMTGLIGVQERERLKAIQSALTRIEQDRYGICESCGGQISEGRLEAKPEAAFCIECRERLDAEA